MSTQSQPWTPYMHSPETNMGLDLPTAQMPDFSTIAEQGRQFVDDIRTHASIGVISAIGKLSKPALAPAIASLPITPPVAVTTATVATASYLAYEYGLGTESGVGAGVACISDGTSESSTPSVMPPIDFNAPNVTGMSIDVKPISIGNGSSGSDRLCSGTDGFAWFSSQQNGDDSSTPYKLFLRTVDEVGNPVPSIVKWGISYPGPVYYPSNSDVLNCVSEPDDPSLKVCDMPPLSQKNRDIVSIVIHPNTDGNLRILASTNLMPENQATLGLTSIKNPNTNTLNPGVTLTKPYYGVKYSRAIRWKAGEKAMKIKGIKCWKSIVRIRPLFPGSDSTKNIKISNLSVSVVGTKFASAQKSIKKLTKNGTSVSAYACTMSGTGMTNILSFATPRKNPNGQKFDARLQRTESRLLPKRKIWKRIKNQGFAVS